MILDVPKNAVHAAARVAELERECEELRERSDLVHAMLEANHRIAAARFPDGVIAEALRAMRGPLGFSRSIYFSVDRGRGIEARFILEGDERVRAAEGATLPVPHRMARAHLRGEHSRTAGRGWHAFGTLEAEGVPIGLLYGDGHARHPASWVTALVKNVAAVAAVALENETLFAHTRELASRDPLTGLYNRRAFAERVAATMQAADATHSSFAFVLIDLDDFKSVNDRFGHAAGDDALRAVAAALVDRTRAGDVVARYAGDEFALLMNGIDPTIARTLVARLSADLVANGLRCSLGAALYPRDAHDARGLLEAADRALYAAKAAGKNGFSFFE